MNKRSNLQIEINKDESIDIDSYNSLSTDENFTKIPRVLEPSKNNLEPYIKPSIEGTSDRLSIEKLEKLKNMYESADKSESQMVDNYLEPFGVKEVVYNMYSKLKVAKMKNDLASEASHRYGKPIIDNPDLEKDYLAKVAKLKNDLASEASYRYGKPIIDNPDLEKDYSVIEQQYTGIKNLINYKKSVMIENLQDQWDKTSINIDANNAIDIVNLVADLFN